MDLDGDFNTFFQRKWFKFTFANTQLEIPWGLTLGNHDAQANLNGSQIVEFDMEHGMFSMTQLGPPNVSGATNYYIPVYSSFNPNHPSLILWFLDTKFGGCMG